MTQDPVSGARAVVEALRAKYQENSDLYKKQAADYRCKADQYDVLATMADEDIATCDLMLAREHSATIYENKRASYLDSMTTKGDEASS